MVLKVGVQPPGRFNLEYVGVKLDDEDEAVIWLSIIEPDSIPKATDCEQSKVILKIKNECWLVDLDAMTN